VSILSGASARVETAKGASNAEKLFELREIPSDNQIRNLLDPLDPKYLGRFYRQTYQAMEQAGVLKSFVRMRISY